MTTKDLSFFEFLTVVGISESVASMWASRGQVACAFGRNNILRGMRFLPIDCAAMFLVNVLGSQMTRSKASWVVRELWGTWLRVVSVAESSDADQPVFLYICDGHDRLGNPTVMATGSFLDCDSKDNLESIAAHLKKATGFTARTFVAVSMKMVLAEVRAQAKEAGFDFSAPMLPLWGSPQLDAILAPYDASMPADLSAMPGEKIKGVAKAGEKARATLTA